VQADIKKKCRLCNSEGELQKSHIIPEFVYQPIYAEHRAHKNKHRAYEVLREFSHEPKSRIIIQKGLSEKLLCRECENFLNEKYEKYFNQIWFRKNILPEALPKNSVIELSGLDYNKFKLFHLSVLFRASVSSLPEFNQVSLGLHEEKIRQMILSERPDDDTRYAIIAHAISKNGNQIQYNLISCPFKMRQSNGFISYGFAFAGCAWYYIIDQRGVFDFADFRLRADGTMKLAIMDWEDFLDW
jgi:hypothetical protein